MTIRPLWGGGKGENEQGMEKEMDHWGVLLGMPCSYLFCQGPYERGGHRGVSRTFSRKAWEVRLTRGRPEPVKGKGTRRGFRKKGKEIKEALLRPSQTPDVLPPGEMNWARNARGRRSLNGKEGKVQKRKKEKTLGNQ